MIGLDWSAIDPSIFGTLFERALDPGKRAQLGAHYTSREDIETIVDPVVMAPLRQEWDAVRAEVAALLKPEHTKTGSKKADAKLRDFMHRLQHVTVLVVSHAIPPTMSHALSCWREPRVSD